MLRILNGEKLPASVLKPSRKFLRPSVFVSLFIERYTIFKGLRGWRWVHSDSLLSLFKKNVRAPEGHFFTCSIIFSGEAPFTLTHFLTFGLNTSGSWVKQRVEC